jgi:bifunctional UDP-N-acetylglucosamine pyrophosphorylase/glucosamine-1-phosphate N-acetyltransferase
MKIFRMNEERVPHIEVSGRTLKCLQEYFLSDITEIKSLKEIPSDIEGFYAVVYNDTPLLTREFLNMLVEECEALKTSYRIGDGFLTKKGMECAMKTCEHALAKQVKTLSDIPFIASFMKKYTLDKFSKRNILIYDPDTTFIDVDVEIGDGTIIHPMTMLKGKTKIGKNAVIFGGCELIDTEIGNNVDIRSSYALKAKVGDFTTVGPFACLRAGANIGAYCRVGDFVEVKNSTLSDGVKAAHLAYVGDSDVGENTNIGCGTVFANYDGKSKRRCTVGSNVFIGANTNLIAPVTIHDGAFCAAGGTITEDVPHGSLCIARSRQVLKANWERK